MSDTGMLESIDEKRRRRSDRGLTYALKNGTGLILGRLSVMALGVVMPVLGFLLVETLHDFKESVHAEIGEVSRDVKGLTDAVAAVRTDAMSARVDVTRLQDKTEALAADMDDLKNRRPHK